MACPIDLDKIARTFDDVTTRMRRAAAETPDLEVRERLGKAVEQLETTKSKYLSAFRDIQRELDRRNAATQQRLETAKNAAAQQKAKAAERAEKLAARKVRPPKPVVEAPIEPDLGKRLREELLAWFGKTPAGTPKPEGDHGPGFRDWLRS